MAEASQPLESPAESEAGRPEPSFSTPQGRSGRGLMINVVIPLLLLFTAAGVVWMLGTVEPEKRPAADTTRAGRLRALPPVRVERLRSLESTGRQLHLEVDGNVVPFREARVAAEVAGRVIFKADDCEAGSYVNKDQLLMRIDDTDYRLEVDRLSRQQEQEYEALSEVDQEMVNAQRLIEVAKQDVLLQQKEVERQKALPAGFASTAEIDQANRALLAATQQLVSVENQLDLLRKRRRRLEASERLAATQLQAAEVNLKRTEIRAPIEGVIVSEDADLNTFVARGSTLVTIEDTSKVEVATNLRMDQLYWVLDQKGEVINESARGYDLPETPAIIQYDLAGREGLAYRWRGRLLRYDGIGLDPVTRTVPVRVVVDNPREYSDIDGNAMTASDATPLVRGMYVRVSLLLQPQSRLVVVPARALQPGNRVLQFVPDESVLDPPSTAALGGNPTQPRLEPSLPKASPVERTSFDPSRWEPGRVEVRQSVNPVDSLTLDRIDRRADASEDSEFAAAKRMWVCEVRDPALGGDSLVVVSPLGDFDEQSLAVRAERAGMSPKLRPAEAETNESTAAAERGDVGDAS